MTDLETLHEILSRSKDLRGKWVIRAVSNDVDSGDVILINDERGGTVKIWVDENGNIL